MEQLKSHYSTTSVNCQDEGGRFFLRQKHSRKDESTMIFRWLGHHHRISEHCRDGLLDQSVLNHSVCRALDISQQTTSITGLDPLVKWQAINQSLVSLRTFQAGQHGWVHLSTCGGWLFFLASCLMSTRSDKLRLLLCSLQTEAIKHILLEWSC